MKTLEVGKLFKEGVIRYSEGIRFDITDSGCNLMLYFNEPDSAEIECVQRGEVRYGYYKENNVIMLLFKFGTLQWIDAPYSIHLSKNLTELQEIKEGFGFAVNVYLIDARTGVLKAIRLISFSTRFSQMLKSDIENQKELTFENFDLNLNNIYRKYTTNQLVKLAKVIDKIK